MFNHIEDRFWFAVFIICGVLFIKSAIKDSTQRIIDNQNKTYNSLVKIHSGEK